MEEVIYRINQIPDAAELFALYENAQWVEYTRNPAKLIAAVRGSLCCVTAHWGGTLVGLARAVGDGESVLYIQDVLVHTICRRRGIGTRMVELLREQYPEVRQKVVLADRTKETLAFYIKAGFSPAVDNGMRGFIRIDGAQ